MDTLADICKLKREHITRKRKAIPESELFTLIRSVSMPRQFKQALQNKIHETSHALIAEIKKASPSKGIIRNDFEPIYSIEAKQIVDDAPRCTKVLSATGPELNRLINIQRSIDPEGFPPCKCPVITVVIYDSGAGHVAFTKSKFITCESPNTDPDFFDRIERLEQFNATRDYLNSLGGN